MKTNHLNLIKIGLACLLAAGALNLARSQDEIPVIKRIDVLGLTKPILVSLDGFSDEVTEALNFDLFVQGFNFVAPDAAQYQISGGNAGNVQGRVVDRVTKKTLLSRSYTGASLRRQAHAFADDIVQAITGKKGIAQTKIAFKVEASTAATAKFTWPILTATTRKPSRTTTPSLPRRPGCRAGWRFITRRTSPAIRTFFTTTSAPASAGSSRVIPV